MRRAALRARIKAGALLAGTFVKVPAHEIVEVLAQTGLDFICLDAEHGAFDRARMDACLAVGRALDFPVLVRVAAGTPQDVLQALDAGAVGVVVPHVDTVEKAAAMALATRYGPGGRGYAGGSRWGDFGEHGMAALVARSQDETVLIVQIEEVAGVQAAAGIAAVPGVDALFVGPADLSLNYGRTDMAGPELQAALASVGAAARGAGKGYVTFVGDVARAAEWQKFGVNVFFVSTELALMKTALADVARAIRGL